MLKTLLSLVLALSLLAAPLPAAFAQDLPPYLIIDPNTGQVHFNPSALTPGEPINLPPPAGWPSFQSGIPGTDFTACVGCMTFNTYTTPEGTTVVVPTGYAAVVMALTGQNPFNTEPTNAILSGPLILAALGGVFQNMGIGPEGNTPEEQQAWLMNALQNNPQFAWSFMLEVNASLNIGELYQGQMFWAMGLFEFQCHPVTGECASVPVPPTAGINPFEQRCLLLGHCTPITGICTGRNFQINIPDPVYFADKLAPNFPVVVGQDTAQRGVDVRFGAQIPVITVSYNKEVTQNETACRWQGAGSGAGGCGSWGGAVDYSGGWQDWMATDPDWGVSTVTTQICERETRTYIDPITNFGAKLQLDDESIAWIEAGELQTRYPGARVYQANWNVWPGLTPSANTVSPDHTSISMRFDRVPLKDPGHWRGIIWGRTTGTPYTSPRVLQYNERAFWVDVFVLALTK